MADELTFEMFKDPNSDAVCSPSKEKKGGAVIIDKIEIRFRGELELVRMRESRLLRQW